MKSVAVLLSTYNGEKYIREQIDSVLRQKDLKVFLLVRDDGSSDNTIQILMDYQKVYSATMKVVFGENIGVVKSFYSLIVEAKKKFFNFDYFAFCDQDDIWLPEKLLTAVESLEKNTISKAKLYCSRTLYVDSDLNDLKQQKIEIVNSLYANLVTNRLAGCTQVFNSYLLDKISIFCEDVLSQNAECHILHDCLLSIVAYSLDAFVFFDDYPHILYRQHGSNVVGIEGATFFKRLKRTFFSKYPNFKIDLCTLILNYYGEYIPASNKNILFKISDYKNCVMSTLRLALCRKMYVYSWKINVALFFKIIMRKF